MGHVGGVIFRLHCHERVQGKCLDGMNCVGVAVLRYDSSDEAENTSRPTLNRRFARKDDFATQRGELRTLTAIARTIPRGGWGPMARPAGECRGRCWGVWRNSQYDWQERKGVDEVHRGPEATMSMNWTDGVDTGAKAVLLNRSDPVGDMGYNRYS